MIELLRFLYPQFQCTIHQQNVTILLILGKNLFDCVDPATIIQLSLLRLSFLAHRFEFQFIASACRSFILLYLSKLRCVTIHQHSRELIEQDDGTRVLLSSMLDVFCIWFREFAYVDDPATCEVIRTKLVQCRLSTLLASDGFQNLEDKIQWRIVQGRAKHLEKEQRSSVFAKKPMLIDERTNTMLDKHIG